MDTNNPTKGINDALMVITNRTKKSMKKLIYLFLVLKIRINNPLKNP